MNFENRLSELKTTVDKVIGGYLSEMASGESKVSESGLVKAMGYSIEEGGHRIRPILSCFTAEAFGRNVEDVLGYGCAVEMIHAYSLIHDDLPCMDDDDFRRGKPSNHKVFGEAMAVLAGDALSTEAFLILAKTYKSDPALALELVEELAKASGAHGMVGGQALDVALRDQNLSEEQIQILHSLKTGGLLRASVMGAAKICGADETQKQALEKYSSSLGLAFQIADDLQDSTSTDEPSIVKTLGIEKARTACKELIAEAQNALAPFGKSAEGLRQMAGYVYERAQK